MKIILSRKGFDSTNGGIPSPILPDGTMLSMPIPSDNDAVSFCDLQYGGITYLEILRQLATERQFYKYGYNKCHFDPDLRENVRIKAVKDWQPAFGQIDAAQTFLSNNKIGKGDLFLFFGRFRRTTGNAAEGTLQFDKAAPIIHIIYGYMEVGEVVPYGKIAEKNYHWHPHGLGERLNNKRNALYLPSEKLSFDTQRPGCGLFTYSENLILTFSAKTATWKEIPALLPNNITANRKNSAKGAGIYYAGTWQEMVLKENDVSRNWAKGVFI